MRAGTYRWTTGAAAGVLLLSLGGCGLLGGSYGASSDGASSAGPSVEGQQAAQVVASASPGATVAALPVLASKTGMQPDILHSRPDVPFQVDLNALVVSPTSTRLTFTLWNKAEIQPGVRNHLSVQGFGDGVNQIGRSTIRGLALDGYTVDGVYLVDSVNSKEYLPARTKDYACVCSTDLGNTEVSAGSGLALWAVYAPLPANVTTVDVNVPGLGLFEKVPVSRAVAP